MAQRILVVEDDAKLAELVRSYLSSHGFEVTVEARGDRAVDRIVSEQPDLVLLDLMLPGLDGMEVCRRARPHFRGPIVMLTARGEDIDEILGLEVGADDYLAKPVRPRVLLARVKAHLRRIQAAAASDTITLGRLVLDARSRSAALDGTPLSLTTGEFDLLAHLAERAGEVVPRDALYEALRGITWDGVDRSIDLRVSRLRKKLGDEGAQVLKSVRGAGYLLVPEV